MRSKQSKFGHLGLVRMKVDTMIAGLRQPKLRRQWSDELNAVEASANHELQFNHASNCSLCFVRIAVSFLRSTLSLGKALILYATLLSSYSRATLASAFKNCLSLFAYHDIYLISPITVLEFTFYY